MNTKIENDDLNAVGQMKNWLTIDEMCQLLKVKKSWIYQKTMVTGPGCLPRLKVGKSLRFNPSDVKQWIVKRQTA